MSPQITSVENNIGKKSSMALPKYFDGAINMNVLRQVILGVASNNHRSTSQTKTRAQVRGGGRKPWKQKGTGRARQGSSRAPHWIGGGITFGPSSEVNYSHSLSRALRTSALRMVIKLAYDAHHCIIVDALPVVHKTKDASLWLATLPIGPGHIIIIDAKSASISRGFSNLPYVSFQSLQSPRIDYIAQSDWIIITNDAVSSFTREKSKIHTVDDSAQSDVKVAKTKTSKKSKAVV